MTTHLDLALTPGHTLPEDHRDAALAGRVWRPELGGPSVVAIRPDGVFDITASFPTMRDLCESRAPGRSLAPRQGRTARRSRGAPRQHAARAARCHKALAPRAHRSAGHQGRGRHLRHLDARARDRGAGARQPRRRRRDPRRDRAPRGRGFRQAQARLARGCAPQGGARRPRRLEPISRGRHRPGRGNLHEVAAAFGGRHPHGRRHPSRLHLEQPRARGRARGELEGRDRRRRRSATT